MMWFINMNNKSYPKNLHTTLKFSTSWLQDSLSDVTSYTNCINSASPRNRCSDRIRHARDLLRKMTLKNKGKKVEETSDHNADLAWRKVGRRKDWGGSLRWQHRFEKILARLMVNPWVKSTCQKSPTSHRNGSAPIFCPT